MRATSKRPPLETSASGEQPAVAPQTAGSTVVAPVVTETGSDTKPEVKPAKPEAGGDEIATEPNGSGSAHHPPPQHPSHPPPPHVEKVDPDLMYKQGVQAYVKGDAKTALGLLQKARGAAPGFAPTWRVLGQVYEKLGDHGQAKAAFLRYLSLAPTAPDADQIRQRVEHL